MKICDSPDFDDVIAMMRIFFLSSLNSPSCSFQTSIQCISDHGCHISVSCDITCERCDNIAKIMRWERIRSSPLFLRSVQKTLQFHAHCFQASNSSPSCTILSVVQSHDRMEVCMKRINRHDITQQYHRWLFDNSSPSPFLFSPPSPSVLLSPAPTSPVPSYFWFHFGSLILQTIGLFDGRWNWQRGNN